MNQNRLLDNSPRSTVYAFVLDSPYIPVRNCPEILACYFPVARQKYPQVRPQHNIPCLRAASEPHETPAECWSFEVAALTVLE